MTLSKGELMPMVMLLKLDKMELVLQRSVICYMIMTLGVVLSYFYFLIICFVRMLYYFNINSFLLSFPSYLMAKVRKNCSWWMPASAKLGQLYTSRKNMLPKPWIHLNHVINWIYTVFFICFWHIFSLALAFQNCQLIRHFYTSYSLQHC